MKENVFFIKKTVFINPWELRGDTNKKNCARLHLHVR